MIQPLSLLIGFAFGSLMVGALWAKTKIELAEAQDDADHAEADEMEAEVHYQENGPDDYDEMIWRANRHRAGAPQLKWEVFDPKDGIPIKKFNSPSEAMRYADDYPGLDYAPVGVGYTRAPQNTEVL